MERDFICESEIFNGPKCRKQCARCKGPKPRREDPLTGYEIRSGKDGKVGIYTRDYNCRLATFNSNTHSLQKSLAAIFDRANAREKKRKETARLCEAAMVSIKCHRARKPVLQSSDINKPGYYAGPPMPTRP